MCDVHPSASEPPARQVFVLGAPRSGTTFLASLLKRSGYGAPIETQCVIKYRDRLSGYPDIPHRRGFDRLARDMIAERAIAQWHPVWDAEAAWHAIDAERLALEQASVPERPRRLDAWYGAFVEQLMRSLPGVVGQHGWVEKTPHYLGRVAMLERVFPEAAYLHIVRDVRDVALSIVAKPWGPNNLYTASRYWARLNAPSPALDRAAAAGRVLSLRFEDLVEEPAAHIDDIHRFLRTSIEPAARDALAASARAGRRFGWRDSLPESGRRTIEAASWETMRRLGYAFDEPVARPSFVRRASYRCHDRMVRNWFLLKTNTIDALAIRFFGRQPFGD